jgi:hypothetical protein
MNIPRIAVIDDCGADIWSGTLTQFARDEGYDVAREVIAQWRACDPERPGPACIGGGAQPLFYVLAISQQV